MDDRERKCREYVETRRGAHDQHAEMLTECFIAGASSEAAHWEARVKGLERTVSFFASVIKSGESWSPTCEAEMAAFRASEGEGK